MDHINSTVHELEGAMRVLEDDGMNKNGPELMELDFIRDQLTDYINELEGELYGVPAVEDWE